MRVAETTSWQGRTLLHAHTTNTADQITRIDEPARDMDADDEDVDEENDLVCSLIQGSSSPRRSGVGRGPTRPNAAFSSSRLTTTTRGVPVNAATSVSHSENAHESSTLGDEGAAASTAPVAITASRKHNARYARFVRVRRAAHSFLQSHHVVASLSASTTPPDALGAVCSSLVQPSTMEWLCCVCQSYNYVSRTVCRRCNQPEAASYAACFPPTRQVILFPNMWVCEECGVDNPAAHNASAPQTGGACASPPTSLKDGVRNEPAHAVDASETAAVPVTDSHRCKFSCHRCAAPFPGVREWYCPTCTHVNAAAATQCATCFTERPACWTCPRCECARNSVFVRRCRSCGNTRPGHLSDSTQRCIVCQTRNDVRWELCAMCMTPLSAQAAAAARMPCSALPLVNADHGQTHPSETRNGTESHRTRTNAALKHTSDSGSDSSSDAVGQKEAESHNDKNAGEMWSELSSAKVEGAWWCHHCNVTHRRNAGFCDICLRPRRLVLDEAAAVEATPTPPTLSDSSCDDTHQSRVSPANVLLETPTPSSPQPAPLAPPSTDVQSELSRQQRLGLTPGSWQCPYCRQYHLAHVLHCCQHPREVAAGYWLCLHCGSVNRQERTHCLGCHALPAPTVWLCPRCESKNAATQLICLCCGAGHPRRWACATCGPPTCEMHAGEPTCRRCGVAPSSASGETEANSVPCTVCAAPNHRARRSCFRCHARLQESHWVCGQCGVRSENRSALRCPHCHAPRVFDIAGQEVWVCELCSNPVYSGGDLPVREQCPRCGVARHTNHALTFPSRWQCGGCAVWNACNRAHCGECQTRRTLVDLNTSLTCPRCLRTTPVDVRERCAHCAASLSDVITDTLSPVAGYFTAPHDMAAGETSPNVDMSGRSARDSAMCSEDAVLTPTASAVGEQEESNETMLGRATEGAACDVVVGRHERDVAAYGTVVQMPDIAHPCQGDMSSSVDASDITVCHRVTSYDNGAEVTEVGHRNECSVGDSYTEEDDDMDDEDGGAIVGEDVAVHCTDYRVASWTCPTCTNVNAEEETHCALCALPRPREE